MGTLCNLNLVIFKCFYYQSEKIVAGDINSLNLLVLQYSAQVSSNSLIFNKGALEMNLIGEVMEDHTLDGIIKPFGWTNKSVLSKLWVFLTFLWVSLVLNIESVPHT